MEEAFLSLLQIDVVKVALCSQHGGCYTEDNIVRHLAEQHEIKRKRRRELIRHLHAEGLAASKRIVVQPSGSAPLFGLPILQGYQCCDSSCSYISTSEDGIEIHCRVAHRWSSGVKGRKRKKQRDEQLTEKPYKRVAVQTLWTEKMFIDYFVVQEPCGGGSDLAESGTCKETYRRGEAADEPSQKIWDALKARYDRAQEKQRQRRTEAVTGQEHRSELTP